jgi:hypothetical protein
MGGGIFLPHRNEGGNLFSFSMEGEGEKMSLTLPRAALNLVPQIKGAKPILTHATEGGN